MKAPIVKGVNPPRGGLSDSKRIVYQAAEGERVVIKGSEVVKNWKHVENDTWTVTLPNTYFGDSNPYNDLIQGEWYATPEDGFDRHTGAVYLNEKWLSEASDLDRVLKPSAEKQFWYARVDNQTTTLWAQFKGVHPNNELVEIQCTPVHFLP